MYPPFSLALSFFLFPSLVFLLSPLDANVTQVLYHKQSKLVRGLPVFHFSCFSEQSAITT